MNRIRSLALTIGVMLAATLPINAVAAAAAAPTVTPQGVGALRLGATATALHRQNLIGGLRKGCPRLGQNSGSTTMDCRPNSSAAE